MSKLITTTDAKRCCEGAAKRQQNRYFWRLHEAAKKSLKVTIAAQPYTRDEIFDAIGREYEHEIADLVGSWVETYSIRFGGIDMGGLYPTVDADFTQLFLKLTRRLGNRDAERDCRECIDKSALSQKSRREYRSKGSRQVRRWQGFRKKRAGRPCGPAKESPPPGSPEVPPDSDRPGIIPFEK